MDVFVFGLKLFLWMVYNTKANSAFSVYINGSTSNGLNDSMNITCTVFGLTLSDFFKFKIELHQRRNFNIIRPVKSTPERLQQTTDKYCWSTSLTEDNITPIYNATVHLFVLNTNYLDEGIYTCYATVNSVTRFRSIMLPEKVNTTSYVIIRSADVHFQSIPDACCKYGYTVFEDDSVLNEIQLRQNEFAYFPVWPLFKTIDRNISVAKPWVSFEGCHNISTTETTEKMDCKKLSVTEWLNKTDELPLIGMMLNGSCVLLEQDQLFGNNVSYSYCQDPNPRIGSSVYIRVYSIMDNGSNASAHGKWDDARNICNNLNTSLPGIDSTFITIERARIINSTICLAVVQTSSIAFQPIIKQITKDNNGIVLTTIPRNSSQILPFVCKDNKDIRQLIPYVCDSHSSSGETGEFPTLSTDNVRIEGTTNEDTPDVSLQPNSAEPEGSSSKQMVIIISSVVASLVTLVVLCVIVSLYRKRISQRNENLRIKTEVKTNIYNPPSEELNDNNRRTEGDIQLEEMYSTAEETDSSHIKRCSKEHVDNKNTEDEDFGEYDVLRGKRQNERAPHSENIYDRANNAVSGIYDSTSTQPVVDIYTI